MSERTRGRGAGGPVLIGWNEYVDLPDWGVRGLRAKVDTGARSSALHVEHIRELPRGRVRFDVILDRRKSHRRVHVETRIRRRARVRSSTGQYTQRIFVATRLVLGPVEREIEVSLVDRGPMIFRMLLGRTALAGAFWIDVGHRALFGRPDAHGHRKGVHPQPKLPRRGAQASPGSTSSDSSS